jgi:hypothetical protein
MMIRSEHTDIRGQWYSSIHPLRDCPGFSCSRSCSWSELSDTKHIANLVDSCDVVVALDHDTKKLVAVEGDMGLKDYLLNEKNALFF